MGKMKMLDPKNVITKSTRMMRNHVAMFSEYLGDYEVVDSKYYFGDDSEWVSLSYVTDKKLLTKIFAIRIQIVMHDIDMPETWKAKTQLLGSLKAEGIVLKESRKENTEIVRKINGDDRLMDYLFNISNDVDLQNIEMEYNKEERKIIININPYAGAFVWIKLPPIYYDLNLKKHEVETLIELLSSLKSYFDNYKKAP